MNWRLYGCDVGDTILFNNGEICIERKTFFCKESFLQEKCFVNQWFTRGINRIVNLLDEKGEVLPFPVF